MMIDSMQAKEEEEFDGPVAWLSKSKFQPPTSTSHLIARPLLIDLLENALNRRLIVVAAPAGFGKSTLLAQWCAGRDQLDEVSAWLTLDEADAEPNQFLTCLIHALDNAGFNVGELSIAADDGLMGTSVHLVLRRLAVTFQQAESPTLLVIDDYHRAKSPAIDKIVLDLAEHCAGNLTLCLASREKLFPELASMLASGEALEIDAAKLRFTDAELRIAVGVDLTETVFAALQTKVEGWPVAIQLARLLLNDDTDHEASIAHLHGHTGHLAAYLTEQVIERLSPEQRNFVLKTSILDTFDAELADAVCGHDRSSHLLKALEPLHALLIPLDHRCASFRYHHLFAECLQDLLHQQRDVEVRQLHLNAARCLGERGDYSAAVRHGMTAKHDGLCADLVCRAGGWELVLFGGIGRLNGLLRHFPQRVLKKYPRLQFAKSYLALKNGEISEARAYFDCAASSPRFDKGDAALMRDHINMRILIEAYEDNGLVNPDNDFIHEALDRIGADDSMTRGIIQCNMALRHTAFGRFEQARQQAETAARSMREARSVLGLNYAYLHLGMVAFYTGRYQVATANFERATDMARDNFGADSGLKYLSEVYLQAVRFWKAGLDDSSMDALTDAVEHMRRFDGWFENFAIGYDALFHHAMQSGRYQDAWETIRKMEADANERGIERLRLLCSAFRLIYFVRTDDLRGSAREYEQVKAVVAQNVELTPSANWLILFFCACACAQHLAASNARLALTYARRAHEVVAAIGADFFVLRSQLMQALVLDAANRRRDAVEALLPALKMASTSEIAQPFLSRDAERLLRATRGRAHLYDEDVLMSNFISDVLGRNANGERLLSECEMQVMEELAAGKSNKEIARVLDRTENTVKFHVKNIFAKLNVTRRMQAVTAAKALKLIE
ncbi:MAG: hypothetical protein F4149_05375 [Gammaproteobacteria bacterium]|nr:hypothetical protein [Gammaproteobacteria bacterium]